MQNISDSIIRTAMQLESIANRHIFSHIDMTSASIKIMCVLSKCPTCNTPTKILELIGGTRSNISQRLDYLEKNGLITRKHATAESDKRKVSVLLTAKGKRKLLEAEGLIQKANMYLEKHFTQDELAAHFAFFKKLNELLDAAEKNPDCKNNL
jgi:DNA-binding MarR family transcriptional regulator